MENRDLGNFKNFSSLEKGFLKAIADEWWLILIRGIVGVLFGFTLFFMPGASILVLVILFAALLLVDGVAGVFMGFKARASYDGWWVLLVGGLCGVVAGVLAFIYPSITALILTVLVGLWSLSIGIVQIYAGIKLRKEIENEWLIILSGVLSLLVGLFLVANPIAGAVMLVWVAAFMALFYGIFLILASFKFKKLKESSL